MITKDKMAEIMAENASDMIKKINDNGGCSAFFLAENLANYTVSMFMILSDSMKNIPRKEVINTTMSIHITHLLGQMKWQLDNDNRGGE